MFLQKWREHWGLKEEPFVCEDADKDVILDAIDASSVHSGFDRVYGNPRVPTPAIVFGEKGSGKSALRLMMRRRLDAFNRENPDDKVFLIEYIDFNGFIEHYRQSTGIRGDDEKVAKEAVSRIKLADHLDCVFSLGITKLVDEILEKNQALKKVPHKQTVDLLLGTALYYHSDKRTTPEAMQSLSKLCRFGSMRPFMKLMWACMGTLLSIFVGLMPIWTLLVALTGTVDVSTNEWGAKLLTIGSSQYFYWIGGAGVVLTWGWYFLARTALQSAAQRACRSVKMLNPEPQLLTRILGQMPPKERNDFTLPHGSDDAIRYDWLHRFLSITQQFGYKGVYVVVDRLDEPSLLSGQEELMRRFVEKMLDIKLLQYPQLGIKLFLPIELDDLHRNASPEQLKRMRLDKSNLIPELKWSGQELYEIANQRMRACRDSDAPELQLADWFADELDFAHVKETLNTLGTPRYAFGFLSALLTDYVKELPNDLPENDPRWKIDKAQFDVLRAAWIDRTGILRRVLN